MREYSIGVIYIYIGSIFPLFPTKPQQETSHFAFFEELLIKALHFEGCEREKGSWSPRNSGRLSPSGALRFTQEFLAISTTQSIRGYPNVQYIIPIYPFLGVPELALKPRSNILQAHCLWFF